MPFKTNDGIHRRMTFRSASVVKPFISMLKVVRAGNIVVLYQQYPHVRSTRDGTGIKLDEQRSVHKGHVDLSRCKR